MDGSILPQGFQAFHLRKSFTWANTAGGGADTRVLRATRKSPGCRATMTTSTMTMTTTMASIFITSLLPVARRRIVSATDQNFEPAPEHALGIERHFFGIHHLGQARVLHHFGVDPVALAA